MAILCHVRRLYPLARHGRALSTQSATSPAESFGIYSLLNDSERRLLDQQRALVQRAQYIAKQVGLSIPRESTILDESVFTVVVAGEFNSGKSTLINALVGRKLLETGTLPTTDCITILSHEAQQEHSTTTPGVLQYSVDLPLLRDMALVDTPGTNALVNHTARTLQLLPKADAILFVTSADRPFPESERRVLEGIQQYRKSITIVINKMDILDATGGNHGQVEKQKLVQFVANHASDLLGANPTVLAVSARDALAAKLTSPPSSEHESQQSTLWQRSNFGALETFLRDTLTLETRVKAKLLNPLGVAEGWIAKCQEQLAKESRELEADRVTLNLLASQRSGWRKDLQADMERARREIGQRLDQEDPGRLAREWNKTQAIAYKHDTVEAELTQWITETAHAIALSGRAQGQTVIEFLGQRPSSRNKSLVGSITTASKFEETRDNLQKKMTVALQRFVLDEDLDVEQRQFLNSLQSIARMSATALSLAFASLGASAMQFVDLVPGIGMGAIMALSGAAVLSRGRSTIVQKYMARWEERNQSFQEALQSIQREELDRVEQHIQNGVTPYTRFVEADDERIAKLSADCQDFLVEAHILRKTINRIGSG